jgi:hypothetical protein
MDKGHGVTLLPVGALLTTQQGGFAKRFFPTEALAPYAFDVRHPVEGRPLPYLLDEAGCE